MPEQQTKVVEVPSVGNIEFPGAMTDDQISTAIKQNYPALQAPEPTTAVTVNGKTQNIPRSQLKQTLASGAKLGPANQQNLTGPSTLGTVAREGTLGLAGGVGLPESKHPISDLVTAPFRQQYLTNPEAEGAADAMAAQGLPKPLGRILGGIFSAQHEQLTKSKEAFQQHSPTEGAIRGLAGIVPIIGPAALEAGSEIGQGLHIGEDAPVDPGKIAHGAGRGVGTVLGLLFGSKGGQGATEAAVSKTIRPVMETAGPSNVLTKILGGGEKAMSKAPLPQQTAAGAATNAEVTNYAASKGIDLLPGQATGSRGLKGIQAVGERAIVGGEDLETHLADQHAKFANAVDDFKAKTGNSQVATPEDAGLHLKAQAQSKLDALKASAQKDYQSFQRKVGDIPVDLSDVKAKYAAQLSDEANTLRNLPEAQARPIRNVLKKLSDLRSGPEPDPQALADFQKAAQDYGLSPGQQTQLRQRMGLPPEEAQASQFSINTAQQLRSAYLDIARDFSGNISKRVQKIAGQAAADIDAAMQKAAQKAGAANTWRQANSKWKQLQQVYNDPQSPITRMISEPNGQSITQKVLTRGQYGGDLGTIKAMKQQGFDLSPIRSQVVSDIAEKNFVLGKGGKALGGYSDDFLKELFEPQQLNELKTMGRVGRAIKFEMNPSGTSNVQAGERQLHGIMARTSSAITAPVAAKITMSPAVRDAALGIKKPVPVQTPVNPSILQILGQRNR